ncbi:hypothetical protein N656DRAFT_784640 [Canariomyces notabilis]|uniref:Uncharacterized protein n=1 Tax=Canariomyces notabilis TaxID=2074819 RepID=A0AAN6T8T9_9PEZI|nr:hypothetical protein N656DRAFT_784640 [Canariomyces arenarius]
MRDLSVFTPVHGKIENAAVQTLKTVTYRRTCRRRFYVPLPAAERVSVTSWLLLTGQTELPRARPRPYI